MFAANSLAGCNDVGAWFIMAMMVIGIIKGLMKAFDEGKFG